ncbi:hypothetical protein LEMLEM_LOCUS19481 [Lemmus lemmus]
MGRINAYFKGEHQLDLLQVMPSGPGPLLSCTVDIQHWRILCFVTLCHMTAHSLQKTQGEGIVPTHI